MCRHARHKALRLRSNGHGRPSRSPTVVRRAPQAASLRGFRPGRLEPAVGNPTGALVPLHGRQLTEVFPRPFHTDAGNWLDDGYLWVGNEAPPMTSGYT